MSVPTRWASSYRYKSFFTANVADIITNFRAEAVTYGSPAWTEPTANEFLSPADAWGRQFRLTFSVISAAEIQMNVKDPTNNVITGRMDIAASPNLTQIDLFTGQQHFMCTGMQTPSTYEFLHAGIVCVDFVDDDQAVIPQSVFGGSTRDSNGANRNPTYWEYAQTLDNGGWGARFGASTAAIVSVMPDGSIPAEPVLVGARDLSNYLYLYGHLYQAMVVNAAKMNPGINFQVAIAPGVLATFRVCWVTKVVGAGLRVAYRIS